MSRIVRNTNNWGTGDLNGTPSSVKTNGGQVKRYGPLGVAGVSGMVKNHGGLHEVVFEVSGDEIWQENGVNSVEAQPVRMAKNALIDGGFVTVHEKLGAGSTVDIMLRPDVSILGADVVLVAGVILTDLGTVDLIVPPTQTLNTESIVFLNMNASVPGAKTSKGRGFVDIVLNYKTL